MNKVKGLTDAGGAPKIEAADLVASVSSVSLVSETQNELVVS